MPKASYKISIYPHNVAAIRYAGALDPMVTERAIDESVKRACIHMVVDLTEVTYCCSAAVGTFIAARNKLQERSGRLVFINPPPQVNIILEMMGFRDMFTFYQSLDTALRDLITQISASGGGNAFEL